MRPWLFTSSVVLVAGVGVLGSASEVAKGKGGHQWEFAFGRFVLHPGGRVLLAPLYVSDIDLQPAGDDESPQLPGERSLTLRLSLKPRLLYRGHSKALMKAVLAFDLDLLRGAALYGEGRKMYVYSRDGREGGQVFDFGLARLNAAYLAFGGALYSLALGRQRSHLGLGVLANRGDNDLDPRSLSFDRLGDVVDRVALKLRPLLLSYRSEFARGFGVILAFDHIERDLFADRTEGDLAYQGIFGLSYGGKWRFTDSSLRLRFDGTYLYRWQRDVDGDRTRVHIADAGFDFLLRFLDSSRSSVRLAGEGVLVMGGTQVSRSQFYPEGQKVASHGWVVRSDFDVLGQPLLSLEGGLASGDDNPFDGTYTAFTMNPDYRVGVLLFSEYLKAQTARSATNMANPRYLWRPPGGLTALTTDGGVQNARYVRIGLGFRPWKDLLLQAAFIGARADRDVVDPYWSSVEGQPRNHVGGKPSDDLGYELDLGATYVVSLGRLRGLAGLTYAVFVPGRAFADDKGRTQPSVQGLQGRLVLAW